MGTNMGPENGHISGYKLFQTKWKFGKIPMNMLSKAPLAKKSLTIIKFRSFERSGRFLGDAFYSSYIRFKGFMYRG